MKIDVMLASGDTDNWESIDNARMDMSLGGALIMEQGHGEEAFPVCVYAAGMWIKFEVIKANEPQPGP